MPYRIWTAYKKRAACDRGARHDRSASHPATDDGRAVRRRRRRLRRGGHHAVGHLRLARRPAAAGRRGPAGRRRRRPLAGVDVVRHRLVLRPPGRADPVAAGRAGTAGGPALRVAAPLGVGSVLCSLVGFLRWVFVVPALAESYVTGDAATRTAVAAAWTAQHQFGGALLGEHLGQLLAVAWSIVLSAVVLRTRVLPAWLGVGGIAASVLYLLNQGDVLATAVPGFPVWEPAGPFGSSLWGLWVVALGVCVWRRTAAPPRLPVRADVRAGESRAPVRAHS